MTIAILFLACAALALSAWRAYRRERRTAADILREHEARVMRSVRETPQLPPLPEGWTEEDRPRAIVVRDASNGAETCVSPEEMARRIVREYREAQQRVAPQVAREREGERIDSDIMEMRLR